MQSTSVFGFFPAPSPSGSMSTDSLSTGDSNVCVDVPAQDDRMYAEQLLQSPPQQLQLQLHELQLLVRPQSQRTRGGPLLLDAPYGTAERRQTTDLGGGSRGSSWGSSWGNRTKNTTNSTTTASNNTTRSIRRRISRACDQCNQLRTKCDGQYPCVHCLGAGLVCAYIRARKKRGKASRRELALKQAEAAASAPGRSGGWPAAGCHSRTASETYLQGAPPNQGLDALVGLDSLGHLGHLGLDGLGSLDHLGDLTDLADLPSQAMGGPPTRPAANDIDLDGFDVHETIRSSSASPLSSLPSLPSLTSLPSLPLRYPVLAPLLPHLAGILSAPAACDLLDAYFARAASSVASLPPHGDPLRARLPFALDLVVRRRAVLHPTAPRPCRPALLASVLWVAATTAPTTTDDDGGGGGDAGAGADNSALCRALWALTVNLLPPMLAAHPQAAAATTVAAAEAEAAIPTAAPLPPSVDDVIACIHLAAGALGDVGQPWWHAAWSLARRLQLGRERPEKGAAPNGDDCGNDSNGDGVGAAEERRRVWWLAYMADRGLALRWRRPLFLMDAECADLRQPADEVVWQEQEGADDAAGDAHAGACGPPTACSSGPPGVYSTLLPLMVLVGETIDLLHARSHPLLGSRCGGNDATPQQPRVPWDVHATALVTEHLAAYEKSLEIVRLQSAEDNETTTVYVAHATHMVGVLRDMLASGWDAAATTLPSVQPVRGQTGDPGLKTE